MAADVAPTPESMRRRGCNIDGRRPVGAVAHAVRRGEVALWAMLARPLGVPSKSSYELRPLARLAIQMQQLISFWDTI